MQVINPKTNEVKDIEDKQLQGLLNRGWIIKENEYGLQEEEQEAAEEVVSKVTPQRGRPKKGI